MVYFFSKYPKIMKADQIAFANEEQYKILKILACQVKVWWPKFENLQPQNYQIKNNKCLIG